MNHPLGHRCQVKAVNLRKDDAPAADQAVITNVAGPLAFSGYGGGLIQTTPMGKAESQVLQGDK
jgi:hypothetical protein